LSARDLSTTHEWPPTADEAVGDLLVDAIRDHAAPALEEHGVHVVGIGAGRPE